ncbi:hypothetical protein WA158_001956 [Blastocystis sp. Blastoise]
MTNVEIIDSKEAVESKDIAALESKLGLKFPEEYKKFLLEHNGGIPEPCGFVPVGNDEPTEAVDFFLSIGGDDYEDIYTVQQDCKDIFEDACISQNDYVPIAVDGFGNKILICTGKKNNGRIYFLSAEQENFRENPNMYKTDENCVNCPFMYYVADSFDEWLETFTESGENDEEIEDSIGSLTPEEIEQLKAQGINVEEFLNDNGSFDEDEDEDEYDSEEVEEEDDDA